MKEVILELLKFYSIKIINEMGSWKYKGKIQAVLYGRRERSAPPPPSSYFSFCFVFYEVVIIERSIRSSWSGWVLWDSGAQEEPLSLSLSLSLHLLVYFRLVPISLRSSQGKMRSIWFFFFFFFFGSGSDFCPVCTHLLHTLFLKLVRFKKWFVALD